MAPRKAAGRKRSPRAVTRNVDAASANGTQGSIIKSGRSRSPANAAVPAPAANMQTIAPHAITIAEVTAANMIREFEEARLLALKKGQAAAAVTASIAKAKLAGLFSARPEGKPALQPKFDGNYTEAARRIAFLLRLAAIETASGPRR